MSKGAKVRHSFNPRACGRRDEIIQIKTYFKYGFNPRACGRRDKM